MTKKITPIPANVISVKTSDKYPDYTQNGLEYRNYGLKWDGVYYQLKAQTRFFKYIPMVAGTSDITTLPANTALYITSIKITHILAANTDVLTFLLDGRLATDPAYEIHSVWTNGSQYLTFNPAIQILNELECHTTGLGALDVVSLVIWGFLEEK